MNYIYNDGEIEFAKYIKTNPPNKIWWDSVSYVFDYGDKYFEIVSVSENADSQNEYDEAIIGQFRKHLKAYVHGKHAEIVCEKKAIENLYIVRTFLYFTTFREYTNTEKFLKIAKQKIKSMLTLKKDIFGDMVSQAVGGCEEIICHPKSKEVDKVNSKYSNLIDCGLLLQIDGKYLKAFVEGNGFGFHIGNDEYFTEMQELENIAGQYEFIKI